MAIANPVVIYDAENDIEAELLCAYLEQHGIEAYAVLDESRAGIWMFGTLPGIYKPQVWIDKSNFEAAKPLLQEYEHELLRRRAKTKISADSGAVEAVCEECGKTTRFPESKRGTVQDCEHCGAFVDVGDEPADSFDS
jgi:hypothetical protein